ncbi:MAG: recombinase family protein [Terriglobales bacterium]
MCATVPIAAAQYLRMSTEHQQYSLNNQESAIRQYADKYGFSVTQTYTDAAKSGVVLRRRSGLRQLLQDVMSGHAPFKLILVYDVSRWGRFQDNDEAAHYEFMCKAAGVPVHYCAEVFSNDGSTPSSVMKALKRSMAGEYSRELGVKVLAGHKRLAGLGFKQGGAPGYGLRRMLVSPDRLPKQLLAHGECKSIATDRVVLAHGPRHEVQCVRDIYRMLLSEGRTVHSIAGELNRNGVPYVNGVDWDHFAVKAILTHPKYMGCHVYGRTSQRLSAPVTRNPTSEWILTPGSYEPIVDSATFRKAQQVLLRRTINKSNEELLDELRFLLAQKGRLSLTLMKAFALPSSSTYRQRFGSVRRAYELIGYRTARTVSMLDTRDRTQALREDLIGQLLKLFPRELTAIQEATRWRKRLRLRTGRQISVLVARAVRPWIGETRWQVDPVLKERRLVTLLVRLDVHNRAVQDLFVLPKIDRTTRFTVRLDDGLLCTGQRLERLSEFRWVVNRVLQRCNEFDRNKKEMA